MKIVIFSVDYEEQGDTLRKIQAVLVGPYLAYTRDIDKKVCLWDIENNVQKRSIIFENMITDDEEKLYMSLFRVPKTSF